MNLFRKIERKILTSCRVCFSMLFPRYTKTCVATVNPDDVSDYIKHRILAAEPLMICRFGSSEFDCLAYSHTLSLNLISRYFLYIKGVFDIYRENEQYAKRIFDVLCFNAGFFPTKINLLHSYYQLSLEDIKQIDLLGTWMNEGVFKKELQFADKVSLKYLEPYYSNAPWSEALKGKKVLVIHPFAKTIESQYKKRHLLFRDNRILPDFDLKTIKSVQSIGGASSGEYDSWFEALEHMKSQLSTTDFDVAIIGCGAYGFSLAAHVKRMGKQAIHLGGATQVLFGIIGKRWESIPEVSRLINEHWVRPLPEETPDQSLKIEDGCYW